MNTIIERDFLQGFLRNLQRYKEDVSSGRDQILVPRQFETIDKIFTFLSSGYREGHVTLPTGYGKTVIFAKLIEAAVSDANLKVLVVGPTKIILFQNNWKIDQFGGVTSGLFYGNEKDLTRQVTITTYASLRRLVYDKTFDPASFSLLILDEAHRAIGEETAKAIAVFPEEVVKIGFTATPEFHEEKTVADILPTTIDEMSLREAIETDILAGVKVMLLESKLDISNLERSGQDFEEETLQRTINTPERNLLIVQSYKEHPLLAGKRAVIYCAGKKHGKDMSQCLENEGIKNAYIDGQTPQEEREEILGKFKIGDIKVICNVKVLVEGFDEPEVEVAINAVPTMSRVVAEQRGGRTLRRSRLKDNKVAFIVEVVDVLGESPNTPILFSEIIGASEILSPSNKVEIVVQKERKKRQSVGKAKTPKSLQKPKGNGLIQNEDVIMALTNRNKRQRWVKTFEYAPRGWSNSRLLAYELKTRESVIRIFAEKYRVSHGHYFQRYLTPLDALIEHYHPKLVNMVRRQFMPNLDDMETAEEYAEKYSIDVEKAQRILGFAEETSGSIALQVGGASFFPVSNYQRVIRSEERRFHIEDALDCAEAEEKFWQDDERFLNERERDYWNNFLGYMEEENGEQDDDSCHHEDGELEMVPYDDEHTLLPEEQDGWEIGSHSVSFTKETLEKILSELPDRNRRVLQMRYLNNMTFKQIGEVFGLSAERIHQIANMGFRFIRHPTRFRTLLDLAPNDSYCEYEIRRCRGIINYRKFLQFIRDVVKHQ